MENKKGTDGKSPLERLKYFEESPLKEGYDALMAQISKTNQEIIDNPISIFATEDDDVKNFEKMLKYFDKIDALYDKLEYFRGKMSPDKQKELDVRKEQKKANHQAVAV